MIDRAVGDILGAYRRRLGDLRLECRITAATARADMPMAAARAVDGLLATRDWCGFFNDRGGARLRFEAGAELATARLREGKWILDLRPTGRSYAVPVGSPDWSDEALVELTHADPADAQ